MSENFDFKTAANLLPKISNDLNTVYQLIEACLSYRYKIRMKSNYTNTNDLIIDLKKQSSTALVAQLQQTKQGNLNIDEYGRSIESLLTVAQAGDNREAIATFIEANEKLAIDVFIRGIRNR
ncbi:hypothetical protein FQA39_LY04080 [Lamprigera yunnana]|nr:hypothetical protein FQA39_LY04080 [Lamprigera yunnana]